MSGYNEIALLQYEIEKLRARVVELEERRCEVCGYAEHHREHTGCLRNQVSSLKAENASLKRDAERLDFILRKQLIVIQDYDDKYFTYNAQSGKRGPEMDSEAEAIDAAVGDK